MALTGDPHATDPACDLSPHHRALVAIALAKSAAAPPAFVYRRPRRELGSILPTADPELREAHVSDEQPDGRERQPA